MTDPQKADEIQRRLEQIRYDLHEDVKGLVHNARALVDWRYYLEKYPWACLGVAAAAGFLIVPSRPRVTGSDMEALVELARRNRLVLETRPQPAAGGSLLASLAAVAANTLVRTAVTSLLGRAGGFANHEKSSSRIPTAAGPAPRAR